MEQPIVKTHKKKAMSSEKASFVKKAGHINETEFALIIGGQVISGQGKPDVVKNDFYFSLKKVCKRIQVANYCRTSKSWVESSPSAMICKDILTIYPESFDDYKVNKHQIKTMLRPKMIAFKEHLSEPANLAEYLSLVFTKSGKVQFIVMKEGTKHYIFDSAEAIDIIVESAIIINSRARKAGDTHEQKVLITIPNGKGKGYQNLLELEIRNSSKGHYASFQCGCNRDPLLRLLKSSIVEEAIFKDNLVVRGKAIQDFEQKIL